MFINSEVKIDQASLYKLQLQVQMKQIILEITSEAL